MAEVYKHVLKEEAEEIVQCGLKLSEFGSFTAGSHEQIIRYIPAYFNPKDEKEYYRKDGYRCIRMSIPNNYCYVGEADLYRDTGKLFRDLFRESIVPVEKYLFGTYRNPVCLISRTIQGAEIALEHKTLGYPVLVEDAETLYLHNLITNKAEKNRAYLDAILYAYYNDLANEGKVVKVESLEHGICVFINHNREMVTLRIPEQEEMIF